ncbi:MAG: hypothetical protein U0R50_10505 [Gaiellales bacterium]
MSSELETQAGTATDLVERLVELVRDRGATPAQLEALGELWATAAGTRLSGGTYESALALRHRAVTLAESLLGVDALLAPESAPYGGFWQRRAASVEAPPESPPEPLPVAAVPDEDDWGSLAAAGLTGAIPFSEACSVIEALAARCSSSPYVHTLALLPALPADERARVARGDASWTIALSPLVAGLDEATNVALIGGDGIFELVGAERELLATRDPTRPLGVTFGGDAGRRLAESTVLPLHRLRLLTGLAFEALGVIRAAARVGAATIDDSVARALATHAARQLDRDDLAAEPYALAAKALATLAAFNHVEHARALTSGDRGALDRLLERARSLRAWEGSPARLLGELAENLIGALNE